MDPRRAFPIPIQVDAIPYFHPNCPAPYLATIRVAFVYGPDGEQIELFRELEDKRG